MRKLILAFLAAASLSLTAADTTQALPAAAPGASTTADAESHVEDTRLFCYNRFSGRFLHWGRCGGYRRVWFYRPRVYCRSLYSGRFLHWGHC